MPRPRLPQSFPSFVAVAVAVAAVLLAGCAVGPDYVRPAVEVPAAYKETGGWKVAEPRPADSRQPWWESYGDAMLNRAA